MTLLSPLSLLWLASIPALLWLWRLSATHRQTRIPSLIPFEHLLRREARRRTHLIVNLLFWLQLAALIGLTLALAQPTVQQRRTKRILAILDTSASMGAARHGTAVFERATRALHDALARTAPTAQILLLQTAPLAAVTPAPTSDRTLLRQRIETIRVSHLGGNLSTAVRLGRALLGTDPDETWIVTDEPPPSPSPATDIRWMSVGEPLANVAIVGLDTRGVLCAPAAPRVAITVQNFSDDASTATLTAKQGNRRLAEERVELSARGRATRALSLPDGLDGWIDVTLSSAQDALAVDDHAWIRLTRSARLPIVVQTETPSLRQTLSGWLNACPALTWGAWPPTDHGPFLLITDQPERPSPATATLRFLRPQQPPGSAAGASQPMLSQWVTQSDHPIASYLPSVEVVAAALNLSSTESVAGTPVISALVQGRKVPLVVADEREHRRTVSMWLDPSGSRDTTAVLVVFFNSLRWLLGDANMTQTGEPLMVDRLGSGPVRVRRPDGSVETVQASGGTLRYEATTLAGIYRFTQGASETEAAVNFSDPLESETFHRVTTWHAARASPSASAAPARAHHPLWSLLTWLALVILLGEWQLYSAKGQSIVRSPQSIADRR